MKEHGMKEHGMTTSKIGSLIALLTFAAAASAQQPAPGPNTGGPGSPTDEAPHHGGAWRRQRADLFGPDGTISLEELQAKRPGIDMARMKALDTNHDGKLTREELRAGREQAAKQRFAKLDINGDGVLTLDEMQAARPNFTAEEFNRLDRNGDGVITPDERPEFRGPGRRLGPPPSGAGGAE